MYQTLYRKYRPNKFEDVVGQNVIIKTLQNSIKGDRVGHSYLFYGPRGTGKTTIARIFSKMINCENNSSGMLCGKCAACKLADSNENMDLIEIDAASNNGVDQIRDLKEKINLVPSNFKYKVYIIDEVHMLSIGAFNALLKTLEEPPEHVVFILATTEFHKVPETIVSRCQCFQFERLSINDITTKLKEICKKEKIKIEDDVITEIAKISDGGMRDAIGQLDQLISYQTENITLEDFNEVNKLVDYSKIDYFLNTIFQKNTPEVLNFINMCSEQGKNFIQILNQMLIYMRNKIVDYYVNNAEIDVYMYERFASLINEKLNEIKRSSNPQMYIEIMILDFITNEKNVKFINSVEQKTEQQENKSETTKPKENIRKTIEIKEDIPKKVKSKTQVLKHILNFSEVMKIRLNNAFVNASKKEKENDIEKISKLKDYCFDEKIGYLASEILNSEVCMASDEYIVLSYKYKSSLDKNADSIDLFENLINDKLKLNKKIVLISEEEWKTESKKYIDNLKNSIKYEKQEELNYQYEEIKSDKKEVSDSIISEFGGIVEVK